MKTIYEFVIHTPIWVYLLLGYLLWVGVRALKPRIRSLKKLFIIPAIFAFISIHTVMTEVPLSIGAVNFWVVAVGLGILLGWIQIVRYSLVVDREHHLIQVPGSWMTLIILGLLFPMKYYTGYEMIAHAGVLKKPDFVLFLLSIVGLSMGLFVGRFCCYAHRFYQAKESVDLSLPTISDYIQ